MIYQTNNITNHKSQITNSQAGVTLLLAILILSSVLAISFSLATIMFIEVRSSGDLLKTEPALYAATGIGEQAFFNLERHACPSSGIGCSYTANFSNNVTMPSNPQVLATSTPIFIDKVKAGATFSSTQNKYDFCNTTAGAGGCQYGKVTVDYITTGATGGVLNAYLCEFNPNLTNYLSAPCTAIGTSQSYWKVPDNSILSSDGSVAMYLSVNNSVSWTLIPGLQQQLILTNPGNTGDIFVQIKTFGPDGVAGKGLPYVGKTAVAINTENSAVGRKIQVVVPNSSGSGSVSDTVWVEDNAIKPAGGTWAGDSEGWNWVSSSPSPFSGSDSSQSNIVAGQHQHYFFSATSKLVVNTGDVMVAYVYIDSANLPTEIMLQWNSDAQSWSHRAYWGTEQTGWAISGGQNMYPMGALPAAGQWVRLTVPASNVGLEGQTLNGMAFTLYGGRATWDHAGKSP